VSSGYARTTANAYQREWFTRMKERVAGGEPFAFVNADVPQEIFARWTSRRFG